ncbi:MAG: ribosome small subunit-dependent GTPase A [Phycisphaerales bacterium]
MNRRQREQLEAILKSLPKSEQDRLFREAAAMRAEDQTRRRSERRREEDPHEPRPKGASRKSDPVREYVLRILAREQAAGDAEREDVAEGECQRERARCTGVAVFVGKRRCLVRPDGAPGDASADLECLLPPDLAGRQQSALCVGDRVAFERSDDERRAQHRLTQVLPRRTVLSRRDPRTGEARAIVANVDAVVVVVSVVSPPLHPRLIDRYLIAIEDSWVETASGSHADDPDPAQAIIAVNKIDLLDDLTPEDKAAELAKLEPYRALGVPIVTCAAADARGVDELRRLLTGKIVALVGHSGVGKSSLANALDPRLGVEVGDVGEAANRGRHTTTAAQLYRIDHAPDGSMHDPFWVIDTPGVRAFALDALTPAQLRDSFPELRRLRQGCRFNDCTHTHEPGCAVLAALESGDLHPARYDAYRRLLEESDGRPA